MEIDGLTHVLVIVLKGEEREGERLDVAGLSHLCADQVSELIDWLEGTNGVIRREDSLNVIEAITNTNVLNHIAWVQNVGASGRNLDLDASLILIGSLHD